MSMDYVYSLTNPYFSFKYSGKEFFRLFILLYIILTVQQVRIRNFILILIVSFSLFQYIHFEYFGKNITAIEFYLFLTNINETFETLNEMLSMVLKPLLIAFFASLLIFYFNMKFQYVVKNFKYSIHILLTFLSLFSFYIFYITNVEQKNLSKHKVGVLLYPLENRHTIRNFYISMNYFVFGILPKKLFQQKSPYKILNAPTLEKKDLNKTVILIIGESLRYDKFRLNDNKLTPNLQQLKNNPKFLFKKVYSGGTMTKVSVSTLINRIKYPNSLEQIQNEKNCLFKLAKDNSFGTYFITAQSQKHISLIKDMMCPKYIDTLISRNDFTKYINPSGYDSDLKDILDDLKILNQNNLIILQQRGSHSPFNKQYPSEFNQYNPYDNTVLYTDFSLSSLINYIDKNSTQETFIFFVSDHGELLGKNGKNGHGHLEKDVYEVPFLMFTNSKSKETKELFSSIKSHYDISNYIIYLLGYKADLPTKEDREIYILNSDLDGLSGYGKVNVIDGIESEIEIKQN